MTWKTYTAVSGATVLAGWLAAQAPSSVPPGAAATAAPDEVTGTSGPSTIEMEAARLGARVRQQVEYEVPGRNPFRFGAAPRSAATPAPVDAPPIAIEPAAPVITSPPVTLSGIAENQVGERTERTAILSSPGGVLLVREGDEVMGQFRVGQIRPLGVELLPLDGSEPIQLNLR